MRNWKKAGLAAALCASIALTGASLTIHGSEADTKEAPAVVLGDQDGEEVTEDLTVQEVVRMTMPAMVSITNTTVEEVQNFYRGYGSFFDDFLNDYFGYGGYGGYGGFGGYDGFGGNGGSDRGQTHESVSTGSGVIVEMDDEQILIATNEHVVSGATTLSVSFADESVCEAEMVGSDATHDLAVIRVKKSDVDKATLKAIDVVDIGDSDKLEVGETVIAIGNALGYGQSVSRGIVSALNRSITAGGFYGEGTTQSDGMIQTDASINPGNSGGALLNMRGELIGINSAKFASTTVEGMGYAIPISTAEPILTDIANGIEPPQANAAVNADGSVRLAVTVADITEDYAKEYDIPTGAYVVEVTEGGPADRAGVRSGDIITAIDGKSVSGAQDLKEALAEYKLGDSADLTVMRESDNPFGQDKHFVDGTITVTFAEAQEELSDENLPA